MNEVGWECGFEWVENVVCIFGFGGVDVGVVFGLKWVVVFVIWDVIVWEC